MTARDVIAQALALSEAATDGPWIVDRATEHSLVHVVVQATNPETGEHKFIATTGDPHYDGTVEDAELTAAARTLLPALAKALADVLDVHAPTKALMNPGRHERLVEVCIGCGTDDGNWQVHPCPTRRAITAALSEVTP